VTRRPRPSVGARARAESTTWAALVLAGGLEIVVDPWGWDQFGPARWMFAAAIIGAGLTSTLFRRRLRHQARITGPWVGVLAVSGVACAVAPDPILSALGDVDRQFGLLTILLVFGAYLLGCSVPREGLRVTLRALVVGSAVVAIDGVLQLVGIEALRVPAGINIARARSTLGNADFLGGYLVLVLPVALALAADRGEDRRWRLVAGAVAGLDVIALGGTEARSAWVGAIVGLGLWTLLARPRVPRTLVGAAAIPLLGVAVLTPLGPRAISTLDPSTGTSAGRVATWSVAARVIARRPLVGWGPEGFRRGFEQEMDAAWVQRYGLENLPDRAHNLFLDTAGAVGLIGLAFALWLLLALAGTARVVLRTRDPAVAGIVAGLAAYLVHTQFLFDTFDLAILFWLLAGLIVGQSPAHTLGHVRARGLAVLTGVATAGLLAFGVVGVVADRRVQAGVTSLHAGRPVAAVATIASASHLRPRALEYELLAGPIAVNAHDPTALRAADRLLAAWDDPDIRLGAADVESALGSFTGDRGLELEAVRRYRQLLVKEPNDSLAWLGVGETDARLGDTAPAGVALRNAAALLPKSPLPDLDLALLDLADGDVAGARREASAAQRVAPADPAVRDLSARLGLGVAAHE